MYPMHLADALGKGRTDRAGSAAITANATPQRSERIGGITEREVVPPLDRGTSELDRPRVDGVMPNGAGELVEPPTKFSYGWWADKE